MNMDIKDLIAKLKGGNKNSGKGGGGITAFFEKNPTMKIVLPAVLLAIAAIVAIVIVVSTAINKTEVDTSPVDANAQEVDILPQDVRDFEDLDTEGDGVFDEVDIANAKVTTIIRNSDGYYTAVMETKTNSYSTLQVGDYINGSSWQVEEITDDYVLLGLGDKKVELRLGE